MIRRLPVIPTLIVLAAVAVMIRLGFWQIDRMHQKEALLARYESARTDTDYLVTDLFNEDSPAYRRALLYCDSPRQWRSVAGRNAKGESGWAHIVRCKVGGEHPQTPRHLRRSDYVVGDTDVVLGWSRNPALIEWKGEEVRGTVVPSVSDVKYRIIADPPLAGLEANARPDPSDLPNNHWSYAVQWFLFALVAVVIYALAVRKRLQGK